MIYYEFGTDPKAVQDHREIVAEYRKQADTIASAFPPDMSEGDRLIAWMLMVQAHAIGELLVDSPDEPWKD